MNHWSSADSTQSSFPQALRSELIIHTSLEIFRSLFPSDRKGMPGCLKNSPHPLSAVWKPSPKIVNLPVNVGVIVEDHWLLARQEQWRLARDPLKRSQTGANQQIDVKMPSGPNEPFHDGSPLVSGMTV